MSNETSDRNANKKPGCEQDEDNWERGCEVFEKVMGFRPPKDDSPFLRTTVEHLFANVWGREDGLAIRDRRLITMTIVLMMGQADYLELHLKAALDSGDLSISELEEMMYHVTHYGGWPKGTLGVLTLRKLTGDKDANPKWRP